MGVSGAEEEGEGVIAGDTDWVDLVILWGPVGGGFDVDEETGGVAGPLELAGLVGIKGEQEVL